VRLREKRLVSAGLPLAPRISGGLFQLGGFMASFGNPPFLMGGKIQAPSYKLSKLPGHALAMEATRPSTCRLFFFLKSPLAAAARRIFGLLATNTIAQGEHSRSRPGASCWFVIAQFNSEQYQSRPWPVKLRIDPRRWGITVEMAWRLFSR